MENEMRKLVKVLELFCTDNGIDKSKSGYLTGLFVKHTKALNQGGNCVGWVACP